MRRLGRYFGRRGGFLVLFGLAWTLCGVSFALVPVERFSAVNHAGPLVFMDSRPWPGLLWIVCGLIALVNGLARRRINNEDAFGYAALVVPTVLWTLCYAWSFGSWVLWKAFDGTPPPFGRPTGGLGAVIYAALAVSVLTVANWKDDLDLPHPVEALGSDEMALLDRLVETVPENTARGARARAASEEWIGHARYESEKRIQESAAENNRLIQVESELHSPEPEV